MNPSVIDSLVVELGLDPSKFNKGQQEALDAFKKTQEQTVGGAKLIEEQSRKADAAIGGIRTQILSLAATAVGAGGLVEFAAQSIHAGAAVGRLSRNLGVSVQTIGRFQGLAEQFGGSADGMAQSFASISDALEGWKIGDMRAIIGDFRALGAAGGTVIDINKGVEQTFLDIAKDLRTIHDRDPAMGGYWQRRLGLDPGLYDAMIQRTERFADLLARINTLTDQEADSAGQLERRWNRLSQTLTRAGQRMILDLTDSDSKYNPFKNGSDARDIEALKGQMNEIAEWVKLPPGQMLDKFLAPESWAWVHGGSKPAANPTSAAQTGAFKSQVEKEAFIRAEARKRGINENDAMRVARSEGFTDPIGDNGTSFGAFQLHVTPGGRGGAVGDQFRKKTGLDPSNPANERATIIFALDDAKKNGWGAYHGAARVGMSNWQGIAPGAALSAGMTPGSTTNVTNTISINGPITINAGPNADGQKIATDFRAEVMRRQSFAAQADYGQR